VHDVFFARRRGHRSCVLEIVERRRLWVHFPARKKQILDIDVIHKEVIDDVTLVHVGNLHNVDRTEELVRLTGHTIDEVGNHSLLTHNAPDGFENQLDFHVIALAIDFMFPFY
jgi:hypothetical protein